MLSRLVTILLLALALAGPAVPLAHASQVAGNAVTISGLDDLSATVDAQARKGAGKIIAMVLGMGGLATVLSGRIGIGLAGVGAGIGMGFVPAIMGSAFDASPASTGVVTVPGLVDNWWTPFTAGLYPPLVLLKWVQDPVVWLAVASVICVLHMRHHAH